MNGGTQKQITKRRSEEGREMDNSWRMKERDEEYTQKIRGKELKLRRKNQELEGIRLRRVKITKEWAEVKEEKRNEEKQN